MQYRSVALVIVFGGGGACGKIRRFTGLPGEDEWADGIEEELLIMTYIET